MDSEIERPASLYVRMDCGHFQRYEYDDGRCALCDLVNMRLEMATAKDALKDWQDYQRQVVHERCASDEEHCTCVPALRLEIERLRATIAEKEATQSVTEQEAARYQAALAVYADRKNWVQRSHFFGVGGRGRYKDVADVLAIFGDDDFPVDGWLTAEEAL